MSRVLVQIPRTAEHAFAVFRIRLLTVLELIVAARPDDGHD